LCRKILQDHKNYKKRLELVQDKIREYYPESCPSDKRTLQANMYRLQGAFDVINVLNEFSVLKTIAEINGKISFTLYLLQDSDDK